MKMPKYFLDKINEIEIDVGDSNMKIELLKDKISKL